MIIKERPIITWLLNPDDDKLGYNLIVPRVSNPLNLRLLYSDLEHLNRIRKVKPKWGLPELVMPSFVEIIMKTAPSFENITPELYEEFSSLEECGILLYGGNKTVVYGFGENELHLWYFIEYNGKSIFKFYSRNISNKKGYTGVCIDDTILADNNLFSGTLEERQKEVASIASFVVSYVAVKKYVKLETVIIPQGTYTAVDGTPLEYVEKKKVVNRTGQEVIVMDSKWFRKIVNDNDIFVRGFFRMQNKKNADGEWYKELIFVDSFVRHGYHRNAKIENSDSESECVDCEG